MGADDDEPVWTWEIELGRAMSEIAMLETELEPLREYAEFCRMARDAESAGTGGG